MSFIKTSFILFENDRFWGNLGLSSNSMNESFGNIRNMLSLSKAVRYEILEIPRSDWDAPVGGKKKRKGKFTAKAEDLLLNQPNSIFHLAVKSMFDYNFLKDEAIEISMAACMPIDTAAKQFAIPVHELRSIVRKAAEDPTSEWYNAAICFWRVNVFSVLRLASTKKGGLLRIANAFKMRAKTQQRSLEKFIPQIKENIENWFVPLLAEARPTVKDKKNQNSKKRLIHYYKELKKEVCLLHWACLRFEDSATKNETTRKQLSTHLSKAKHHAGRLTPAIRRWEY
jgi:hypothetical protein